VLKLPAVFISHRDRPRVVTAKCSWTPYYGLGASGSEPCPSATYAWKPARWRRKRGTLRPIRSIHRFEAKVASSQSDSRRWTELSVRTNSLTLSSTSVAPILFGDERTGNKRSWTCRSCPHTRVRRSRRLGLTVRDRTQSTLRFALISMKLKKIRQSSLSQNAQNSYSRPLRLCKRTALSMLREKPLKDLRLGICLLCARSVVCSFVLGVAYSGPILFEYGHDGSGESNRNALV
jgi:hypothetical protein